MLPGQYNELQIGDLPSGLDSCLITENDLNLCINLSAQAGCFAQDLYLKM